MHTSDVSAYPAAQPQSCSPPTQLQPLPRTNGLRQINAARKGRGTSVCQNCHYGGAADRGGSLVLYSYIWF